MANPQYEKGKIALAYSKNQVKKAGECIRKKNGDIEKSIEIIQQYRAAHLYPLMIIKNLVWKHTQKINKNAIIARRLKRLPTIIDKLRRETLDGITPNSIVVTRMSDIGGCRVILNNRDELYELQASLNKSRTTHKTKKIRDYILEPKRSGYRGIHRIYNCYEKDKEHQWKGFDIEVQLRTRLQHLWATTIEIVDLCEGKALKTNPFNADPRWNDFFFIMSEFFADEEGFIELNNETKNGYKKRLQFLNDSIGAFRKLRSFSTVFSSKEIDINKFEKNSLAVMVIETKKNKLSVLTRIYRGSARELALAHYASEEGKENKNVLLVQVDDIRNIKVAYPNYIIDTSEFLTKLQKYISTTYWTAPVFRGR